MRDKMLKVIIAVFLLAAMSHVAFASDYNETYCRSCHGTTVDRHHLLTAGGRYQCTDCHAMKYDSQNQTYYPEVIRNCVTCHTATAHSCISCHPQVSSSDLGLHSSMNGSSEVDNGDCTTCHYGSFPMVKGAVNNSNTYFCANCHTEGGNGTNISSKKFTDKRHGEATCINCHIADGIYHQGNPRGSVNNSSYIARYNSPNRNNTDCADCHLRANLDDVPFNAPSGGNHIRTNGNGTCGGGCHTGGGTPVQAAHSIDPLDGTKPAITVPTLDHSTVIQGTDVTVTATASFSSPDYAVVDGAQYRIMNSDNTQIIKPWTPMVASDGNFNSTSEVVRGIINTSGLSGTYNIEVRGMAGGPSQNPLERYYPMNGDISPVQSVPLTVQPQGGFITGTITSGGSALEGALVTTTGASDITGPDGTYSLSVPPGIYTITASKVPRYNVRTTPGIQVNAGETTPNVDMTLGLLSTGTITGSVTAS